MQSFSITLCPAWSCWTELNTDLLHESLCMARGGATAVTFTGQQPFAVWQISVCWVILEHELGEWSRNAVRSIYTKRTLTDHHVGLSQGKGKQCKFNKNIMQWCFQARVPCLWCIQSQRHIYSLLMCPGDNKWKTVRLLSSFMCTCLGSLFLALWRTAEGTQVLVLVTNRLRSEQHANVPPDSVFLAEQHQRIFSSNRSLMLLLPPSSHVCSVEWTCK